MLTITEFEKVLSDIDRLVTAKDVADLLLDIICEDGDIVTSLDYNLKVFNGMKTTTLKYLIHLKLKVLFSGINLLDYYGFKHLTLDTISSPVLELEEALIVHRIYNDELLYDLLQEDFNNFELILSDYPEYGIIDEDTFKLAYYNGFTTTMIADDYHFIHEELKDEDYCEDDIYLLKALLIEEYEELIYELYNKVEFKSVKLIKNETIADLRYLIDMALDKRDFVWVSELSERLNKVLTNT